MNCVVCEGTETKTCLSSLFSETNHINYLRSPFPLSKLNEQYSINRWSYSEWKAVIRNYCEELFIGFDGMDSRLYKACRSCEWRLHMKRENRLCQVNLICCRMFFPPLICLDNWRVSLEPYWNSNATSFSLYNHRRKDFYMRFSYKPTWFRW